MNALIAVVSVVFKVWGVISARLPGLNKFKGMMTAETGLPSLFKSPCASASKGARRFGGIFCQ